MSQFICQHGAVWIVGEHKPARLTESQVETLLDVFQEAGAVGAFNELYAVYMKAGGIALSYALCGEAA